MGDPGTAADGDAGGSVGVAARPEDSVGDIWRRHGQTQRHKPTARRYTCHRTETQHSNVTSSESSATAGRLPPNMSYDVIAYHAIAGHENVYVDNSLPE